MRGRKPGGQKKWAVGGNRQTHGASTDSQITGKFTDSPLRAQAAPTCRRSL